VGGSGNGVDSTESRNKIQSFGLQQFNNEINSLEDKKIFESAGSIGIPDRDALGEEKQMVQRYMRDRQMEIIAIVEGFVMIYFEIDKLLMNGVGWTRQRGAMCRQGTRMLWGRWSGTRDFAIASTGMRWMGASPLISACFIFWTMLLTTQHMLDLSLHKYDSHLK
jgi:hypothetical protein